MSTTVTYKGQTLTTVENQTKTLNTAGTWVEGDFTLTDVTQGGGEWTTEGIAHNTEPNGAITLKPWWKGSGYVFAMGNAFHGKPVTSVTFDFDNTNQNVVGDYDTFAGSGLQTVSFINNGNNVVYTPEASFRGATNLLAFETDTRINFNYYTGAFGNCSNIERISVPNAFGAMAAPCQNCYKLEYADMGSATTLNANGFQNCRVLQTLILRKSDGIVPLGNVSAFQNTPMRGYNGLTGEIFVPQALISDYQTASNWSTIYAEGYCTFMPIEGSEYEL